RAVGRARSRNPRHGVEEVHFGLRHHGPALVYDRALNTGGKLPPSGPSHKQHDHQEPGNPWRMAIHSHAHPPPIRCSFLIEKGATFAPAHVPAARHGTNPCTRANVFSQMLKCLTLPSF